MSQHDFEITSGDANTGVTVRAAINAALQALASCNSGATEPATTYAYMWWADTTTGILKQRNAANNGWIEKCSLAGTPIEKAIFNAHTILMAISDDTPVALTVAEQTVVGRLTGGNIKALSATELTALLNAATDALKGAVELATTAEAVTGTSTTLALTPADGQAKVEDERIRQAENSSEEVWYPAISGSVVDTASSQTLTNKTLTSPVVSNATASKVAMLDAGKVLGSGTNTDAELADAVTKKHAQHTDTGTTATSFKINSGGNEADLQTTGLTADRDFKFPDIDTMLAGSVLTAVNGYEIIAYA